MENLTIEVADHEEGASKVRRLELRVFLRLERQDGKTVTLCARATQMQQIKMLKERVVLQAEISTSPQSQVQETTPAGSEDNLISGSDGD